MIRDLLVVALLVPLGWSALPSPIAAQDQSVTTYHADAERSGHYIVPGLTWARARSLHIDAAFHGVIAGHVYAQPLYWHAADGRPGLVIVATEENVVYALDAATGAEVWHRALGDAVPHSALPCGNIDPVGITGTPAIDPASQSVYLDAMVAGPETHDPQHLIFGLSLRDGSVLPGWPVNVAQALATKGLRFTPAVQGQRGALLIEAGRVYVPFGGHWGDCGDYHGWVVGIALRDPSSIGAWSTRARGGAVWGQGGVVSDGRSLFVATGNTMGASAWGDGEAVIRLARDVTTTHQPRDFFTPADWEVLDRLDGDLGSTAPLPIDVPTTAGASALILAMGKDGKAYLADRDHLGGIGGDVAAQSVAAGQIYAAAAEWTDAGRVMVVFGANGSACPGGRSVHGIVALAITGETPPRIETAWCAPFDGAGAPIVTTADGAKQPIVWVAGAEGDDRLHGFRGDNGAPVFDGGGPADAMHDLRHFGTILAAANHLYVAGDGEVYAFTY